MIRSQPEQISTLPSPVSGLENGVHFNRVCQVKTKRPSSEVDRVVVDWMQGLLFSDDFAGVVVNELRELLTQQTATDAPELDALEAQAKTLKAEISRLVAGMARTDEAPDAIINLVAEKERTLKGVEGRLAASSAVPQVIHAKLSALEAGVRQRLADLQARYLAENPEARGMLASLLDGPLRLRSVETPAGARFELRGRYTLGPLLLTEGVTGASTGVTPTGLEPVLPT